MTDPVFEKIDAFVRGALSISPPAGAIAKLLGGIKPSARVDPDDKIESTAAEVCSIACREAGLVFAQPTVAAKLRKISEFSERKLEVLVGALAAVGRPRSSFPVAFRSHDALVVLTDTVLTTAVGHKIVPERPIDAKDVCRECRPWTIDFSRKPADTGAWKDQVDAVHKWALKRLGKFKLEARVETGVWTRRGQCQGDGHCARGLGWFELSLILVKVDLGDGVVFEREYELK
jgi:hypothetical protein